MTMGISHQRAPELRVPYWIDEYGKALAEPLKLSDLGDGYKLLYCFQAWCPGCHSRGFPTLKRLVEKLEGHDIGFAVIQTVFEGEKENTQDKISEMQVRYNLPIPFGHDPAVGRYPSVMEDYRTGGTPWFILIDPTGEVIFNDFSLDADKLIELFNHPDLSVAAPSGAN